MARKWSSSTNHTFIVWPPYPAKQTLLLISVLSVYTSVATSWCRSDYLVWERQGWSSSILERKLTAHTTATSSSRRVCCLTSEQLCRHYRWTMQQDGAPAHTARTTMDYLKKSTSTSLNLTCGLQIASILFPWITLFGCSLATTLPHTTIEDGGITEASDSHRVAKTLTAFHW